MSSRKIELSIRGRLILWSVLAGLVVTVGSSSTVLGVTHGHLHGRVRAMMRMVLDDLREEYVEFGGLTDKFLHCVNQDVEEHGPSVTRIVIRSPADQVLYATPPLRKRHHARKDRRVVLPDGNVAMIERDIDDIVDLELFLGLFLGVTGIVSVVAIGFFSWFVGERILRLNQVVEARERALEELKTLTDDIAHDLRTPLTRLNMAAETALVGGSAEKLAEDVVRDTAAMVEMINTMLEISQTDFRIDRTPREELDLAAIVRQTGELYETIAEDQGVALSVTVPDRAVLYSAHRGKIQQVVGNLLDNALKFTPKGGSVSMSLEETPGFVRLRIRDTGCGIAPADLPHVFQRFYRADTSRNLPGNGLGLALVQAVVVSYGGRVTCVSEPGKGAEFVVQLPRDGESAYSD